MEDLWTVFCGESDCSYEGGKQCGSVFMFFTYPSSCINNALVISFNVLLLLMLFFNFIHKPSPALLQTRSGFEGLLPSQIFSTIFNGGLGVVYFSYGIWILQENLSKVQTILPLHQWLGLLFQGFTWFLISFIISLRGKQLPKAFLRLWSTLASLFAGILCVSSLFAASVVKQASVKIVLDILLLPGAILLLLCTSKVFGDKETGDTISGAALYTPLNGQASGSGKTNFDCNVTPFAEAGFISKMSFWWLNPLMRKGKEKTLEGEDIPCLRELDRAENCYTIFMEKLNRHKQSNLSTRPSFLWTIVLCHWKGILISGFFALLKIITLSAGPLLLNAFIKVAEGKEVFKYEGYVLAISLFIAKCLESFSQRHWYFRMRIIGLQVRSLLSAAIYRKQLRLSNAAKMTHSAGNIMNYVTVDAYRVGEFSFWFHQTWTTSLQLCIALVIVFHAVGLATFAAVIVIVLTVLGNTPLVKLQNKFQTKLMAAQDKRLKACSEALVNMKVLKLYAWEINFKDVIERLRAEEYVWLSAVQMRRAYNILLAWTSPVLVSAATFGACYFIGIPLNASNVFTFVATLRLLQTPVRQMPDVIAAVIQAKVALERIVKFLEAPELQNESIRQKYKADESRHSIRIQSASLSWEENPSKLTLRNINLVVRPSEKVAICGEVGSGKSTLLAAILGEVPCIGGTIQAYGKIAYVSQMAWIQTGTIQENIFFGSAMDKERYHEVLEKCSLIKDLEMLSFGDLTEIGERGVNLSGGQKQRIQLARALYQDADIYLLDDPFSAVDAHTAKSLLNEYVMGALSGKAVLLVTHQIDFLPAFDSVLLMSDGEILHAAPYHQLLASSQEFQVLVNAHKDTAGSERLAQITSLHEGEITSREIKKTYTEKQFKATARDQLIKQEEREIGDRGVTPYIQYLNQNKGFLYFTIASLGHIIFVAGQISQNFWMAANVQNPHVGKLLLIIVYLMIGCGSIFILFFRSLFLVVLSVQSSKSIFSQILNSLFHAPMSFYDSTPLGRILSRVSSDLNTVDLDVSFSLISTVGATTNACASLGVLAVVTWPVLFVSIPVVYLTLWLQRYYFASAKELMRINGTTKSFLANHLAESTAGAMTIRAFENEERFFAKNFDVIDRNASPFFHNFAANEWLIQRLELLSATVLSSSALAMSLLPPGTFGSGFVGMALSYGLSLNISLINCIQNQCKAANYIISVERLNQYMHIPSEAPEVIEENRPPPSWPAVGKVEIHDLKVRYRPETPLVLSGISCTFEGGHKIGIVGRTGSGKTTLISALFRLVEPADGKIIIDNLDISMMGLHDLRSRIGIIPQDPTLFSGTLRYNLDPLSQYTDKDIWEVLRKCQLQVVQEKEKGLDALVIEDGSNWSMGQRQLFCLGRALLRRSQILVLDEATASIDNATDSILQKIIRTECADCTVITVAHRIPTVMDCTKVVVMSDGKVMEYDEPLTLMKREGSMFGQLVKEYWSLFHSANQH